MLWFFRTDAPVIVDLELPRSSDPKQQDEKEPGYAIVSSFGSALYELATPE